MDYNRGNGTEVDEENIFRRHFFHYGTIGLCGFVGFFIFYKLGYYDLAMISAVIVPCDMPSYLMRVRSEKNREEAEAIIHIGILAFVLLIIGVSLFFIYPIEARLAQNAENGEGLSFAWLLFKVFVIQLVCIISGVFPRPPRN